jgi:hypothetical protein
VDGVVVRLEVVEEVAFNLESGLGRRAVLEAESLVDANVKMQMIVHVGF